MKRENYAEYWLFSQGLILIPIFMLSCISFSASSFMEKKKKELKKRYYFWCCLSEGAIPVLALFLHTAAKHKAGCSAHSSSSGMHRGSAGPGCWGQILTSPFKLYSAGWLWWMRQGSNLDFCHSAEEGRGSHRLLLCSPECSLPHWQVGMSESGGCLLFFDGILLHCYFTNWSEDKGNTPWIAKMWLM